MRSVLVLTGAGISAESGLSTYRAMDGLWKNHAVKDVATPYGFDRNPALSWRFWSERRADAAAAEPNPAHLALAELEAQLGDELLLVTQNVDGLHQRAGSLRVVELHGSVHASRCRVCDRPDFADASLYREGDAPMCDRCDARGTRSPLRPAVVWFGEPIAQADMDRVDRFMLRAARGRLLFIAAGTSGVVTPASAMVEEAGKLGAETWLINLESPPNAEYFDRFIQGECGKILPRLLASELGHGAPGR